MAGTDAYLESKDFFKDQELLSIPIPPTTPSGDDVPSA